MTKAEIGMRFILIAVTKKKWQNQFANASTALTWLTKFLTAWFQKKSKFKSKMANVKLLRLKFSKATF